MTARSEGLSLSCFKPELPFRTSICATDAGSNCSPRQIDTVNCIIVGCRSCRWNADWVAKTKSVACVIQEKPALRQSTDHPEPRHKLSWLRHATSASVLCGVEHQTAKSERISKQPHLFVVGAPEGARAAHNVER